MGYTHYFRYRPDADGFIAAWPQVLADSRLICTAVTDAGVQLAGPLGTGEPALDPDGIALNGCAERGEDYEDLTILGPRPDNPERLPWFCKTGYRPYDLAVTAILLRCRILAPHDFRIASDGTWADWNTPVDDGLPSTRQLVADLFGPIPDLSWSRS